MTDAELRGHLLAICYERRNNAGGWARVSDIDFSGGEPPSRQAIANAGRHLQDAGLISWKSLSGGDVIGMGRITGPGVDVAEGSPSSNIVISLPKKSGVAAKGMAAGEISVPQTFVDAGGPMVRHSVGPLAANPQAVSLEANVVRATIPIVPTH